MADNEASRPSSEGGSQGDHHDTEGSLQRQADRAKARTRLRMLDERLQIGQLCHKAMPLTVWYGPRPLLDAPIGQLPTRGRWAA